MLAIDRIGRSVRQHFIESDGGENDVHPADGRTVSTESTGHSQWHLRIGHERTAWSWHSHAGPLAVLGRRATVTNSLTRESLQQWTV